MSWFLLLTFRTILVAGINAVILLLVKISFIPAVLNFYVPQEDIIDRKAAIFNFSEILFKKGVEWDAGTYIIMISIFMILPLAIAYFSSNYHLVWEKEEKSQKSYTFFLRNKLSESFIRR